MPTLFNIGSLNVDWVYRCPRIVAPGETLATQSRERFAGGKGANQSVAASRAGKHVEHVGSVGADGEWLIELLREQGVGVGHVHVHDDHHSGHAIIQVSSDGENAILLSAGTNALVSEDQIRAALSLARPGDWVLTQNETSCVSAVFREAGERGLRLAFNPAPMTPEVADLPLEAVELLVLNEQEAQELTGHLDAEQQRDVLTKRCRGLVVITLGARGLLASDGSANWQLPAFKVDHVVDTTGAGDTFVGYLIAGLMADIDAESSLRLASAAASLAVSRAGAIPSIPTRGDVDSRVDFGD